MNQADTNFHSPEDEPIYQVGTPHVEAIDLEQIDQFQPEIAPRSTTSAITDLYTSSQIEAQRYRDQGDPSDYENFDEDQ